MNKNTPVQLTIFTDFVCPWCYLASAAVEKLQATKPEIKVQWLPFPLHPSTPPEGLLLSELFQGANLDAVHERLYKLMDDVGLEYGNRDSTYNSRLAQELAMWADTQPNGQALHKALYRAYFVDNKNLALPEVLLQLVAECELDTEAAAKVIEERSYSSAVDNAWDMARQSQVTGVPCFIGSCADKNYMASGYQPYAELMKFIDFLEGQDSPPA